jgi:3'(2'), 5'-bisphosphate nucleotidase
MTEPFSRELKAAKELALAAGAILMRHLAVGKADVEWKGADNPVTAADRETSAFITAELGRRFPGDAILSEEESDNPDRLSKSRVWIIDPMDGTREFIARVPEFAVMIGLAVDGVARVGAVYNPNTAVLYFAASGQGSFRQDAQETRQLRVDPESDPDRMRIAVSRSHPSARVSLVRRRLGIRDAAPHGSIGLKMGLICEGRAHLYLHTNDRTSQWDTCAPEIILREAGGRVSDIDGAPLVYNRQETANRRGVIASNGALHDRVIEIAREEKLLSNQKAEKSD